jgi:hypothetical protein
MSHRARTSDAPGNQAIGRRRSISRRKHDLQRRNAQSAPSPAHPVSGRRARRLPGRAHVPMVGAQVRRAWEPGNHRSAEGAVLEYRGWHVCARCHRERKNVRATLRSGSELVSESFSDQTLLLVACRPRVRVKRACAVGIARRGAQIGRLGAPCKAGGHWCSLTHEFRCCRAPQFRAIDDPIDRAALPLEGSQPRAAREPRILDKPKVNFECVPTM